MTYSGFRTRSNSKLSISSTLWDAKERSRQLLFDSVMAHDFLCEAVERLGVRFAIKEKRQGPRRLQAWSEPDVRALLGWLLRLEKVGLALVVYARKGRERQAATLAQSRIAVIERFLYSNHLVSAEVVDRHMKGQAILSERTNIPL